MVTVRQWCAVASGIVAVGVECAAGCVVVVFVRFEFRTLTCIGCKVIHLAPKDYTIRQKFDAAAHTRLG